MKWEYMSLGFNCAGGPWIRNGEPDENLAHKTTFEVLNIVGREGWELILKDDRLFYFQRPLR